MLKVLQVHGGMERGGTESVIMNWYRNIDKNEVQFDFTTMQEHRCAYDDEIESMGGKIIYVPPRAKVGNLDHFKALYKCIKKNGPYDAVHSHMNYHGGLVALAARLAGVKTIICHAHNTEDVAQQTLKRKLETMILRGLMHTCSSNLLACGKEAGRFVFGENTNFRIINNAVDIQKFKPLNEEMNEEIKLLKNKYDLNNKLILGHIGRFNFQKNHKFIVDILINLKKKDSNFKFLFIGDGELKEEILESIKKADLENNIVYLGLQSNINIWLNIMDILVFPSLFEGLPVVLVEAQSTGLPCIISDKISSDVDLGLNLVKFVSIDNGTDIWVNEIISNNMKKENKDFKIKEQLKLKGYYLEDNIEMIKGIYEKKSK